MSKNEYKQYAGVFVVLAAGALAGCAADSGQGDTPNVDVQAETDGVDLKADACGSGSLGMSFQSNQCNHTTCYVVQWTCTRVLTPFGWDYSWDRTVVSSWEIYDQYTPMEP